MPSGSKVGIETSRNPILGAWSGYGGGDTSLSNWIDARSGLFWIRGKRGSGKSVAMKHLFTQYRRRYDTQFVIGFFFNELGSDLEQRFEGFLRVILASLIKSYPALFTCIRNHYHDILSFIPPPHERETMHADWSQGDLEHALELIMNNTQFEPDIVLFVDSIDECDKAESGQLIRILQEYSDPKSPINFKACFSSTSDMEVENLFGHIPSLLMQDETQADLERYILNCFEEGTSSSRFDDNELAQILSDVLDKAEGCWLWVEHAVSLVNHKSNTLSDVKKGLKRLPKKMEALYEKFLTDMNEEHSEETRNMLAILLALGPSSCTPFVYIDEFRYILQFWSKAGDGSQAFVEGQDEFMKTNALLRFRVQERLGYLHTIQNTNEDDGIKHDSGSRDKNGRVQLYHSTVKKFLCENTTNVASGILSGQDLQQRGHEILSTACLRFMKCKEVIKLVEDLDSQGQKYIKRVEDINTIFRRLPLLMFALKNFLSITFGAIQYNTVNSDEIEAYWTTTNFEAWKFTTSILLGTNLMGPETTLTTACIEADCDIFVRHQIEAQEINFTELIPEYGSYLCLAAYWGSTQVLRMVFSLECDVNIDYCSPFGTALTIAAARGHTEAFDILLNNGADPDIFGGHYRDPLEAAARAFNFGIVRRLWEHPRSSLTLQRGAFRTSRALIGMLSQIRYMSITEGFEFKSRHRKDAIKVIQILAQNGLDMSTLPRMSVPILLWSPSVESTEVMQLILQDPDIILFQNPSGQNLLHIICSDGALDMVKLIIKRFKDLRQPIDETDGLRQTLLHDAAANSHPGVVEYILSHPRIGENCNAKDMHGLTPLHVAFVCGLSSAVELLLNAGARIDGDCPLGMNVAHLAAFNFRNPEVFDFLSQMPVDVTDDWDRTPLHIAAQYGCHKSVQFLLSRGLNPSITDLRGRTALHCACQNQNPCSMDIIKLLKDETPHDAVDCGGSTPLHLIFHDPDNDELQHLIWPYWDKLSEAECVRKALYILSLDNERFINIQDNEGNTPLHLACKRGLATVIGKILTSDARLDLRSMSGCLAYQYIRDSELREVVESAFTWKADLGRSINYPGSL